MKRVVILFLLMSCGSLQAQRKIDGIYMGIPEYKNIQGLFSSEDYIIVSGNKFTYMIPQYHCPIRMNDTLAECHYKWIDSEFIELTSDESISDVIDDDIMVWQKFDSEIHKDSIAMQFNVDRMVSTRIINIYTDAVTEPYVIDFKSDEFKTILLPSNFDNFHFEIVTLDLFPENSHYTLQRCKSPNYVKDAGANFIEVDAFLDDLYEKIYVNKDFAQVKGHTIIWENRKYKKISPRKKILGFGALKDYK